VDRSDRPIGANARIVVRADGISIDDVGYFAALDAATRERGVARLELEWRDAVPLRYDRLVAFRNGDPASEDVAQGGVILRLRERLVDLANVEHRIEAGRTGEIEIWADGRAHASAIPPILASANFAGYHSVRLVVQRQDGARVGLLLWQPPLMRAIPELPSVHVVVTNDGWLVVRVRMTGSEGPPACEAEIRCDTLEPWPQEDVHGLPCCAVPPVDVPASAGYVALRAAVQRAWHDAHAQPEDRSGLVVTFRSDRDVRSVAATAFALFESVAPARIRVVPTLPPRPTERFIVRTFSAVPPLETACARDDDCAFALDYRPSDGDPWCPPCNQYVAGTRAWVDRAGASLRDFREHFARGACSMSCISQRGADRVARCRAGTCTLESVSSPRAQ
jgi:hypothetical protein